MTVSLRPRKARGHGKEVEAWWYESQDKIYIYVSGSKGPTMGCTIYRKQIESWLRKLNKEKRE